MPQDSFHIRRSAAELDALLSGGKINRISQADKDEVTFIIYTGKTTVKLVLSTNASNARVCLSRTEKEPAPVAPNFCMLLRKHLLGAEILSVSQYAFERIVEIRMLCTSDFSRAERVLVCELMGKYSNLILTENGIIAGALKTASLEDNARRVLLPGAKYAYPVPQDKLSPFDAEGLKERIQSFLSTHTDGDGEEYARFLFDNVAGIALPTARELLRRISRGTPVWEFVGGFCRNQPVEACLLTSDGIPGGEAKDFFAFPVKNGVPMPSLNAAEDEYYYRRETKRAFEDKKRRLEAAVRSLHKKQQKKLQDTLERLKECERMETLRVKGELLTANLYRLERGMKETELENWYDADGGTLRIALDACLTPAQNAQKYFKAYAKQKRTKEALAPRLRQEEEEMRYTDSVAASLSFAETQDDLKEIETELISLGLVKPPKERPGAKKKEVSAPFREYRFKGFRILSGRNNLQNDRLLKSCAPSDIWLHAQKYHSTHVVIATEGRQVSDDVLLFAAEVCAYYSDGKSGKVPVDWCERKFVRKPPKAKAGFVTYTDYKTLLVEPDKHEEALAETEEAADKK